MPSLKLANRLIWFAHCPKAGGTSVEQFMVSRWGDKVGHLHWGWDLWWRRGGWRVANPPNSPQHLVWEDAQTVLEATPDLVFAVVREPIARMASEQRWQRKGRRGTRLGRALAFLPFAMWVRLMLAMAARYPHTFDNHFQGQSAFIPEGATVFHLENGLQPVADWLAKTEGVPSLPEQFPHAIPTGARQAIGHTEAALIAQTFAEDYRRFGYVAPEGQLRLGALDWLAKCAAPLCVALDRRGRL